MYSMTSFPVHHKTIFVLDHSKYFSRSCGEPIEYDVPRSKGSGVIPMAPIYKSLWTCNVESLQEYLRIVFDIYPVDKQVFYLINLFLSMQIMRQISLKTHFLYFPIGLGMFCTYLFPSQLLLVGKNSLY